MLGPGVAGNDAPQLAVGLSTPTRHLRIRRGSNAVLVISPSHTTRLDRTSTVSESVF
jgi:hypothetical protein